MYAQPLNRTNVTHAIERRSIGNYWLGRFLHNGAFFARYVGRSDTCLQRRLLEHAADRKHDAFVVREAPTVKEAYEIECREWHMMGCERLANSIHPRVPRHLNYSCPYCNSVGGDE